LQCYREFQGSVQFAAILGQSNIIALLGGHRSPPKELPLGDVVIWDNDRNQLAASVRDPSSIALRVCINRQFYAPICENGLALLRLGSEPEDFSYDSFVHAYSTAPNPNAIAALGSHYLAFPGIAAGKVSILDLRTMKTDIFKAHDSSLKIIALSQDEEMLATASEKGTLIRVWSTSAQTVISEFRRGSDEADVFSLSFSPNSSFVACTSDKGTLHIFELPNATQELRKAARTDGDRSPGRPTHRRNRSSFSSRSPSESPSGAHPTRGSPGPSYRRRSNPMPPSPLGRPPQHVPEAARQSSDVEAFLADSLSESQLFDEEYFQPGFPKPSKSKPRQAQPAEPQHRHSQSADAHSGGEQDWNQIMPQKTTRFQEPPVPSRRPESLYSGSNAYSQQDYVSYGYAPQARPGSSNGAAAAARGVDALINLIPKGLTPRVFTDKKSTMKAAFTLPGRSMPPSSRAVAPGSKAPGSSIATLSSLASGASASTTTSMGRRGIQTLAQGAPQKGQIAWTGAYELCVVSAGRGGKWEKYVIELNPDTNEPILRRLGYKSYMDDDGL
jgi:WD40 repeat protein